MLADRMRHNGVGMVVGVLDASGSRVVTYGRSGADDGRPLDGDTVFQIGSVTKTITTLLLADMVNRGEVSSSDPASKFLPDGVRMPQRGRPITLGDLATHVSGLPSMPMNFDLKGVPNPYEAYTVSDLHTFLSSYVPERQPGRQRSYSNLGVALLGRLLANRMETDYETLVTERVLIPLGMRSTSIRLGAEQLSRLAPGHGPYLTPVASWELIALPASGSLRSTANDLLRFLAAHLGYADTPLTDAMARQLRGITDENSVRRALGWGVREDGVVRHSGGKEGYRSAVAFHRKTGIGAVVLANARTYDRPMEIALYLVTGQAMAPTTRAFETKPRFDIASDELRRYEGRYQLENGSELEIARNGSRLFARYTSGAILVFEPMGRHEFFYSAGNDDIVFDVTPEGEVIGLTLYGDGKDAGRGESARRAPSREF